MRIVFIGPAGAGKGTQAAQLTGRLNIPHLSTGDMLRQAMADGTPIGKLAAEYIDTGRLVPDDVVVNVIGERLEHPDCKNGCLFDGFPRTEAQAVALDTYLDKHDKQVDLVLALQVPENVLIERLLSRGRDDDNLQTIQQRFQLYESETKPLLGYYKKRGILHNIDGTKTPDDVFQRILAVVDP
jgi:adenylate kinase